ncbi:hypothetical protein EBESD8_61950 [Rhodococcus aetherivorans]|nr:hypothetical protein EBESD8_61950 [Rhodococcus aetherivorans]
MTAAAAERPPRGTVAADLRADRWPSPDSGPSPRPCPPLPAITSSDCRARL